MFISYFFFLIIMFFIPIIIFLMFLRVTTTNSMNAAIDNMAKQSLMKENIFMEQIFSEINKNYISFAFDSDVRLFLSCSDIGDFDSDYLNKKMNNYVNTVDYLDSIYIFSPKINYVLSTQSANYIDNFYNKSWYEKSKREQQSNFISAFTVDGHNLITCSFEIYTDDMKTPIGIFVANIDMQKLDETFSPKRRSGENLYLTDERGIIVYSNDREKINTVANRSFDYNSLVFEYNEICVNRNNNKILTSTRLENNFRLISVSDLSYFNSDNSYERNIFIIAVILSALLAIILSFYSSVHFYKTIVNIIQRIESSSDFKDENSNEFTYITNSVLNLVKNNEIIENKLVEKILRLKKSQQIALQTQLNPHFLFNTLNLVNVIVMRITKSDNDASKVVRLLCDLLSVSLNTEQYIVSVEEEIEYAKKYIEIEKIKSKNKFDVIWNIENNILEYKTIKFILQPIIENSIEHGIKNQKEKRSVIEISAKEDNELLVFTINDNGLGISEEILDKINKNLESDEIRETKNIGISNVHQRIQLIFGEKYGVKIKSGFEGTEVKITLPLEK